MRAIPLARDNGGVLVRGSDGAKDRSSSSQGHGDYAPVGAGHAILGKTEVWAGDVRVPEDGCSVAISAGIPERRGSDHLAGRTDTIIYKLRRVPHSNIFGATISRKILRTDSLSIKFGLL